MLPVVHIVCSEYCEQIILFSWCICDWSWAADCAYQPRNTIQALGVSLHSHAHASATCNQETHLVMGHAGVGSALAGDAVVELIETGSLTAAVDQAMVSEPPDQELTGSPRDMDYDAGQQDPLGGSPVSDENNTDFAAVHSVLSAIDAREPTSD